MENELKLKSRNYARARGQCCSDVKGAYQPSQPQGQGRREERVRVPQEPRKKRLTESERRVSEFSSNRQSPFNPDGGTIGKMTFYRNTQTHVISTAAGGIQHFPKWKEFRAVSTYHFGSERHAETP